MDLYIKLFEVLFPVFFIVGIGFILGKKNFASKIKPIIVSDYLFSISNTNLLFCCGMSDKIDL